MNEEQNSVSIPGEELNSFRILIAKLTGDMKFVGIFTIIYGALTCLTIIGAVIGIPLIIAGIRIREAAEDFSSYKNSNNFKSLHHGFERQSRYFFIVKVLIIVGLVLFVIYMIGLIALIASGFWELASSYKFQ